MTWKTACLAFALVTPFAQFGCGAKESQSLQMSETEQDFFGKYQIKAFKFSSFDNTRISVRLFEPNSRIFPGQRPTLIFANSWVLDEHEYEVQARRFASEGYLVLSFATRGFGRSEGRVAVASEDDIHDVSSLIDWLDNNTEADINNIGMAGVSYGGGLSLLSAAYEPRIKTVVSLSGWGDLEKALYGDESIRKTWIDMLLLSGKIFGRLDPEIFEQIDRLRGNYEADTARAWAQARSPLFAVERLNARQVPVFVGNSYNDNLFPPTQMRAFFEQLQGPKKFYMDRGLHASSAVPGLFGLPSAVWDEVYRWMNHWLKNENTRTLAEPPVSFQTEKGREYFEKFPDLSTKSSPKQRLHFRSAAFTEAPKLTLEGGLDSAASSGLPLISEVITGVFQKPVQLRMGRLDPSRAAIFQSDALDKVWKIRGSPRATLQVDPHKGPMQMVAYLYDVDSRNLGTLVTQGVISKREGNSTPTRLTWDLNIAAYDVAPGHSIALVIDTVDPLYEIPQAGRYQLTLENFAELELPITP